MKKYIIKETAMMGDWYLEKGGPRHLRGDRARCTMTHKLKDARKFKTREDAEAVLKEFTPILFVKDGSATIVEVDN
jgi:hypothetical protein